MWAGKVSAGRVLTLVEHLHLNPFSRVRMIALGEDLRFIGWDVKAEIAADQFDQLLAIVSGFSKSGPQADSWYPRPGAAQRKQEEASRGLVAPTIAEFNVESFMRKTNI